MMKESWLIYWMDQDYFLPYACASLMKFLVRKLYKNENYLDQLNLLEFIWAKQNKSIICELGTSQNQSSLWEFQPTPLIRQHL